MAAALYANMKGHRVTLFEKNDHLGGQLKLAAKPPGKEKIQWFIDYMLNQMKAHHIKVFTGNSVTAKTIFKGNPDAVILATGATPLLPDIPGINDRVEQLPFIRLHTPHPPVSCPGFQVSSASSSSSSMIFPMTS